MAPEQQGTQTTTPTGMSRFWAAAYSTGMSARNSSNPSGNDSGVPEERIDIADLQTDAPLLRYQVATHGKLIEGDPRDLLDFQIRAWKDYLNNEKFLDLQAAFLKKALM
jgi:hypothetical protein